MIRAEVVRNVLASKTVRKSSERLRFAQHTSWDNNMADIKSNNRKVLVGNLPVLTKESELQDLFTQAVGSVISITIPVDGRGLNAGHAFVEMLTRDEALVAVEALNGTELHGRTLNMSIADQPGDETRAKKRGWFGFFK